MPRVNPRLIAALETRIDGPTDAELLCRFVSERDSGAFELLVWRHASLVLRVCRSILRNQHEAEDAAQAAFLALARQAGSIRGANIAGWLFRVARRISTRSARRLRKRLATTDIDLDQLPASAQREEPNALHERILHEELARLPERYQLPVLLCFFEGHTYAEAAQRLGWPVGTVAGRVSRAKNLLGERLARRGVSLTGLVITATAVPSSFARATASAAMAFVQGNISGIQKTVFELVSREVNGMFALKAIRCIGVLACGVLAFSFGWALEPPIAPAPQPVTTTKQQTAPKLPAPVVEKTFAIAPVTTELQRLSFHYQPSPLVVVILNASAMYRDPKTLDLNAIDFTGVEKGLAEYLPSKGGVHFNHRYVGQFLDIDDHRAGMDLLKYGWEGLGRKVGFEWARSDLSIGGVGSWDDWMAPLRENENAAAEEKAVGDDRVQAYPVRTPLSRVLTSKAVGGVVVVNTKLDARKDDWIPAEVEKSAGKAIAGLKLPKGKTLSFYFRLENGNRDNRTLDRLRELCVRWAAEHGLFMENFTC